MAHDEAWLVRLLTACREAAALAEKAANRGGNKQIAKDLAAQCERLARKLEALRGSAVRGG